jgi:serine phosphatase RsbU (regulator of sigma subunit)
LQTMKEEGTLLAAPLVHQGEFIGLITLGPRRSEQGYAAEDTQLLNNLATQAAPAFRVADLVREQRQEAQQLEQIEQELRVARSIQQTLLPKEQLELEGWIVKAHYQPARAVGGDFYDFIQIPDGRISIIIGDVSDKGVPAALVMAMTRTLLRDTTKLHDSPGAILNVANDSLAGDIPEKMFVTCFYAILDPATGKLIFANAGHDVPFWRTRDGVKELRARGMPLGLMPGMTYDEAEIQLTLNETVLFYTDGLVEAHNTEREMFGLPRIEELIAQHPGGPGLVPYLLEHRTAFTGPGWEQEDDTTTIILQCVPKVLKLIHTA